MECLFYNGETGCYELLDFDPRGLTKNLLVEKAKKCLENKGICREDIGKALETVYLLEVKHLKKIVNLKR